MIDTGNYIELIDTDSDEYKGIMNPNPNYLYFCRDTKQIYVGSLEYTRPLIIKSGTPYDNKYDPTKYNGSLYYDSEDKKLYSSNNVNWIQLDVTSTINVKTISDKHIESLFNSESSTLMSRINQLI